MNAPELFRLRLQSLLAHGLAASEIAARVGLAAASEVWGGDAPRERPAWYVWLRGQPGAWQIELAGAHSLGSAGAGACVSATFTVRHYPAQSEPAFARFSAEERWRAAESLDATGTPRIELASGIPAALFTVGTVEWAIDPGTGAAVLALASLDRLRTRTDRGDVVRDVPGWSLTVPIFSLMAGLQAQVERQAARRIVVSRQPGFEVLEGGCREHPDARESVHGEALLVLAPVEAPPDAGAVLFRALQDPESQIVGDIHIDPGVDVPRAIDGDPRILLPVSGAWFGGHAHAHDRVMCGC